MTAAFRRIEAAPPKVVDRAFLLLLILMTGVQLSLLVYSPLDLAPDEAHYWEWSRRLDWNYYSKGPVVAVLIAASTYFLGHTAFAVRAPALLISIILSVVFYLLVRREYGPVRALGAWLILRISVYFFTLGLVITTDAPVLVCWVGWLWCAIRAVRDDETDYWALAGILLGAAVLSKYTAIILFPAVVLFLLLTPSKRSQLQSLGFVLGAVLLGISLFPALWWNMNHGWVSFAHNAGHLGAQKELAFRPGFVAEFLAGQLGLVGPAVLALMILACKRGWRAWRAGDALSGLYLSSVLPLALVCLGLSLTKRIYVNWPMPIYLGGILLVVHIYRAEALSDRALIWLTRGLALNLLLVCLALIAISGVTFSAPASVLPMKKLVGWSELGRAVQAQLEAHGDNNPFIISDDYGVASEIAFYTPSHPEVYCSKIDDRRMNQYDVWGGLEKFKGRTALIIRKGSDAQIIYAKQFSAVSPTGTPLQIHYSGELLREFHFAIGSDFRPPAEQGITRY